ncbi:MAG TPA: Coenzyme F420 hydrogenase/dehydrogenase, beta subunit C-terminal domain [Actinomycetes bacterium]|nr:Coenzyme F420 hydrogenase/dehydrogenase, beta subunit C-terminal domain [Actinomycetes bacterium]
MAGSDGNKTQWRELFHEVVETNLCTGCAACVMACPRDVLEYDHAETYQPFNVELSTAADDCVHGQRGCDICTRACPRFRDWEVECDQALFGRAREPDEVTGVRRGVFLARATDPAVLEAGQDGGLVSALLLWGLETDRIEGALTSRLSATRTWDGEPFLATNRDEVFEAAGSRYTYAANPLAMKEAERRGLKRLALVGMSCQASINGTLQARRVNKYARRIEITLGLLCSKSFAYDGMRRVITEDYGVPLDDIAKVNIKGRFQVWRRSTGELVEIPLKQMQQATREGCKLCPDFAAEHADIATGGLGQRDGWTLAVVRTQRGEDWMREAEADRVITVRPGEEDPAALALMAKLAARSRGRWPVELTGDQGAPRMLPVVQTSGGSTRTT